MEEGKEGGMEEGKEGGMEGGKEGREGGREEGERVKEEKGGVIGLYTTHKCDFLVVKLTCTDTRYR